MVKSADMSKHSTSTGLYILIGLLVIAVGVIGYMAYVIKTKSEAFTKLTTEHNDLQTLQNRTAQSLLEASTTLAALTEELDLTSEELEELEDDYRKEKRRNEDFENQIDDLTGTVKQLDKLSKTDEELLQKYSKVYFLNENYTPSDLDEIDDEYILPGRDAQFFHGDALSFLEDMLDDAKDDDIEIFVSSAYRSFDQQTQLKGQYTQIYGSGANAFSADQGYSEHQLGTTADLTTTVIGGPYESFDNTTAFAWLQDNAHKYGFVLSYPEGNSFYVYEPWHWRFVGVDLAGDLHRDDAHFYDWDQRKIDTYLISIFD